MATSPTTSNHEVEERLTEFLIDEEDPLVATEEGEENEENQKKTGDEEHQRRRRAAAAFAAGLFGPAYSSVTFDETAGAGQQQKPNANNNAQHRHPTATMTNPYLRKMDRVAHSTLQRHIEEQDGALMLQLIQLLECIGTPEAVRHRFDPAAGRRTEEDQLAAAAAALSQGALEKMYAARQQQVRCPPGSGLVLCYPPPPGFPLSAGDGGLPSGGGGKSPLPPASSTVSGTSTYMPTSWKEVIEDVYYICRALLQVIGSPDGDASGVTGSSSLVYKVPREMQVRLLPLLYAWVVDWDVLCRFCTVWESIAETLIAAVRPHSWADVPPVILPWRAMYKFLHSLMDPISPALTRFIGVQSKLRSVLPKLCSRCATCFDRDAVDGLWALCSPYFTRYTTETAGAYMYIFYLLCPFHTLAVVDHQPSECLNEEDDAAAAQQPPQQPPAAVQELIQFIFTEGCNGQTTRMWRVMALNTVSAIVSTNPGLIDLDPFAEPFFTLALRCLDVGQMEDSIQRQGDAKGFRLFKNLFSYELTTIGVANAIAGVIFALPQKTTSPLWNHLRRFVHATRAFLRADARSANMARLIASLFSGMLENARRRVQQQKVQLFDDSPMLQINASSFDRNGRGVTTGICHLSPPLGQPYSVSSSSSPPAAAAGARTRVVSKAHASAMKIPPAFLWTNDTTAALATVLKDAVLVALDCSMIKDNIPLVASLVALAPEMLAPAIYKKVTAAFEHKSQDMNRHLQALELLQRSAFAIQCASAEASDAFLAYTQEQVVPRLSTWMRETGGNVSQKLLRFLWTLCSTMTFRQLFGNSAEDESVFAAALAEHVIEMTSNSRQMSSVWFASLNGVVKGFSAEAFDLVAKKIMHVATRRGSQLECLLTPIGRREPSRLMTYAKTSLLPVLADTASTEEDLTWASTLLEKCLLCGAPRAEVFQSAPVIADVIHRLFADLTNGGRQKEAKRIYSALFHALLIPRCTLQNTDGTASFKPVQPKSSRAAGHDQVLHWRQLGFCSSEEVLLAWDVPDAEHVTFMKDLLDAIMDDVLYVAGNMDDIQMPETESKEGDKKSASDKNQNKSPQPTRCSRLRDIVVKGSGALRKQTLEQKAKKEENAAARLQSQSKNGPAATVERKKKDSADGNEENEEDEESSSSTTTYSAVVEALSSLISSLVAINAGFYHQNLYPTDVSSTFSTPASTPNPCRIGASSRPGVTGCGLYQSELVLGSISSSSSSVFPALHWGFQKRCCSLSAYLAENAILPPRHSIDQIFDTVQAHLLSRVCREEKPVLESLFGTSLLPHVITAMPPPVVNSGFSALQGTTAADAVSSGAVPVEADECPRVLAKVLTAMVTLCNLSSVSGSKAAAQHLSTEKQLYLSNYPGRQPHTSLYFPQSYWVIRASSVFSSLDGNYQYSASLDRKQVLLQTLYRFLFSSSTTVSRYCEGVLYTLMNQSSRVFREQIFDKSAELLETMAIKWLSMKNGAGVEVFCRLLSDDPDEHGAAGEGGAMDAKASRQLLGEGDEEGDDANEEDQNNNRQKKEGGVTTKRADPQADANPKTGARYSNQVLSALLTLLSRWLQRNLSFSFDASTVRLLKALLLFPLDLCSKQARVAFQKSIHLPYAAVHDYAEMWEGVQRLILLGYRYAYIQPARAAVVLSVAACQLQPWTGMPVTSTVVQQLLRMCTNSAASVQKQARFLLNAVLMSCTETRLEATVVPMREGGATFCGSGGAAAAVSSVKDVEVFRERYEHMRANYRYGVLTTGVRFIPRCIRVVSTGGCSDAVRRALLPPELHSSATALRRDLSEEEEQCRIGYAFVLGAVPASGIPSSNAGGARCASVSSSTVVKDVLRAFVFGKNAKGSDGNPASLEQIQSSWVYRYMKQTKVSSEAENTQLSIWCMIPLVLGVDAALSFLVDAIQLELQESCVRPARAGGATSSPPPADEGVGEEAADTTLQGRLERYQVLLHMSMGLLRATKENSSPAQRRLAFQCFLQALQVAFRPDGQQNMAECFLLLLSLLRYHVTLRELSELYDIFFGYLEAGEKKAKSSGEDDRQSRWVANVWTAISRLLSVFNSEFTGELLDRILLRLRGLSNTLWFGRTAMWRTQAANVVNAIVARLPLHETTVIRSNEGITPKVIAYVREVLQSIQFPSAAAAADNANRLAMIKTFALSFATPSADVLESIHEPFLQFLLQGFAISLPEMDDLERTLGFALHHVSMSPMPKPLVHTLVERWSTVLACPPQQKNGSGAPETDSQSSLLPRRSRSELTQALGMLFLVNLHRIGKYAMMQMVAEASLASMGSSDGGRVRLGGQSLFAVLTRVASVEQISHLLGQYEEELKKISSQDTAAESNNNNNNSGATRFSRRTALILSFCAAVMADTSGVPPYAPRLMRRLVHFATSGSLEVQREVKQMFEKWWQTHRETWELEIQPLFTPAQVEAMAPLLMAPGYFA